MKTNGIHKDINVRHHECKLKTECKQHECKIDTSWFQNKYEIKTHYTQWIQNEHIYKQRIHNGSWVNTQWIHNECKNIT